MVIYIMDYRIERQRVRNSHSQGSISKRLAKCDNNPIFGLFVILPMKKKAILYFLLILIQAKLFAQTPGTDEWLKDIGFYADAMVNSADDDHRIRAYEMMKKSMVQLLDAPDSYSVSLDKLPWISVLQGEDFRLVTWQLKKNASTYFYDGFIQSAEDLTWLKDTRPFINGSMYNEYKPGVWYGCLYYDMIPFQYDGIKRYLLFGFNAENETLNTKVADVLDFSTGEPVFGLPVFVGKGDPMTRLMLTYADVSTVHFRYDSVFQGIIHDHLETLQGVGPAGEALPVADGSLEGWHFEKNGTFKYVEEAYDVPSKEPPMLDLNIDRKEDKDILGRPRKNE